jgi:phenol 2-monooxygenase (NADPH)
LDISGVHGGNAYKNFGVQSSGAVVVVRPDGYVGTVASLSDVATVFDYFKAWIAASM